MYAISSVNAGKYRVVSDSLFAAFRGTPRTMQPIQVGDRDAGTGSEGEPVTRHEAPTEGKSTSSLAPVAVPVGLAKNTGAQNAARLPPQAAAAAAALAHVADEVEHAMASLIQKDLVTVRRNDFWIEVEMRTDILFPSGSARLSDGAASIIQQLGSVLGPFPNPIRVEGHTDNKPIRTAVFSSNWELSAARAGSVVRVLAQHGVGPERLAVIGYGEQRPLKANTTPEGRNANRRVVVVILSTELMRQAAPGQIPGPSDTTPVNREQPAAMGPGGIRIAPDPGAQHARTGAVATPDDTPQAAPALAQPAPSTTQQTDDSRGNTAGAANSAAHTGTDPAP